MHRDGSRGNQTRPTEQSNTKEKWGKKWQCCFDTTFPTAGPVRIHSAAAGEEQTVALFVCVRERKECVCVCVRARACVRACVKTITLAMHAMSDCWMNDYYEVLINQKYIESSLVQFSNKFILVNHKHTAWSVFQTNETVRAITNTKSFVIFFWLLKVMSY